MRQAHYIFLLITLVVTGLQLGCDSLNSVKVDNPVSGPPPPRILMNNDLPKGTAYIDNPLIPENKKSTKQTILPVSQINDQTVVTDNLSENQVVATVNGAPIFAAEILERYGKQLEVAQKKLSAEEFRTARLQLIERDLKNHIDRKMLVLALQSTLKKEQLKLIDEQLDKVFEKESERLQKEFQVNSRHELDLVLKKQGTSYSNLRDAFANQQMAVEYMRAQSKVKQDIGRQELLNYYREHIEDYSHAGKAKWQQIVVNFSNHGGKQKSLNHLEEAVKELQSTRDFTAVAKKYSDGPEAYRGGFWDWTQQGSLADSQVEKALFELPVGMVSQVIVGENSYKLIKIVDRKSATRDKFETVQAEIKEKIERESRKQASRRMLAELKEQATIHTIFDDNTQ